jgi:adenylate cyclase
VRWAGSRLRTEIFLAFSTLIVALLVAAFGLVQLALTRQAERTLTRELEVTGRVFRKLVDERQQRLAASSKLLAGDFALRRAVATYDPRTLGPVAVNYRDRIGAGVLWITDESGVLLADAAGVAEAGTSLAATPPLAEALAARDEAVAIGEVRGALFQLVAVPVLGPDVIGYLVLGTPIDDATAEALDRDTGSAVTFLAGERLFASSWPSPARVAMATPARAATAGVPFLVPLDGARWLSILVPIASRLPVPLHALVQRSYDEALEPLRALRRRIALIGVGGLLVALLVGIGLAHGITAPVARLVGGMREVLRGNLAHRVEVPRRDEIGFLARSFNEMAGGLEERERIRDVMNKVVSPEVAHELLEHGLALGGEVREVSVLFADIRDFSALAEGTPPTELLALLNASLGHMSRVVEQERGVVDKYLGDGIMAVFGAPLAVPDHAERAVRAGLGMLADLARFNAERAAPPVLRVGIGIATGRAIAGNVGSSQRLNYTVLGDTVNLAARLQELTKEYGVALIVTEATWSAVAGRFTGERLGRVSIRGRQAEATVYSVVA